MAQGRKEKNWVFLSIFEVFVYFSTQELSRYKRLHNNLFKEEFLAIIFPKKILYYMFPNKSLIKQNKQSFLECRDYATINNKIDVKETCLKIFFS